MTSIPGQYSHTCPPPARPLLLVESWSLKCAGLPELEATPVLASEASCPSWRLGPGPCCPQCSPDLSASGGWPSSEPVCGELAGSADSPGTNRQSDISVQRPVFRSHDQYWPMRGQYSGHTINIDQGKTSAVLKYVCHVNSGHKIINENWKAKIHVTCSKDQWRTSIKALRSHMLSNSRTNSPRGSRRSSPGRWFSWTSSDPWPQSPG